MLSILLILACAMNAWAGPAKLDADIRFGRATIGSDQKLHVDVHVCEVKSTSFDGSWTDWGGYYIKIGGGSMINAGPPNPSYLFNQIETPCQVMYDEVSQMWIGLNDPHTLLDGIRWVNETRNCTGGHSHRHLLSAPTHTCPAGTTACSTDHGDDEDGEHTACYNLRTNKTHCGSCAHACGVTCQCINGLCVEPLVNECATHHGGCDTRVTCTDTPTGRTCGNCTAGWTGTGEHGCVDINECATSNGGCGSNQRCTNTAGSRTCAPCPTGTAIVNGACVDVNECATANGGCSIQPPVRCTNSNGGFSCGMCPAGYTGNGQTCTDVNECATNHGACDALVTCANTAGSRTCGACPAGYTGTGTTACTDVNECAVGNGGCAIGETCTDLPGSHTCGDCPTGYSVQNGQCADINECATLAGGCVGTICHNTPGSFTCVPCAYGYVVSNSSCVQINECATSHGGCSAFVTCTPTIGGHTCGACPAGYAGDGTTCTDVNECATDSGGCGAATCTNTPGSFTCGPCPTGYTGSGGHCTDIDECEFSHGGCDPLATCTNTVGSFICGPCPSGFTLSGGHCVDVNECATTNGGCLTWACTNTVGSFTCTVSSTALAPSSSAVDQSPSSSAAANAPSSSAVDQSPSSSAEANAPSSSAAVHLSSTALVISGGGSSSAVSQPSTSCTDQRLCAVYELVIDINFVTTDCTSGAYQPVTLSQDDNSLHYQFDVTWGAYRGGPDDDTNTFVTETFTGTVQTETCVVVQTTARPPETPPVQAEVRRVEPSRCNTTEDGHDQKKLSIVYGLRWIDVPVGHSVGIRDAVITPILPNCYSVTGRSIHYLGCDAVSAICEADITIETDCRTPTDGCDTFKEGCPDVGASQYAFAVDVYDCSQFVSKSQVDPNASWLALPTGACTLRDAEPVVSRIDVNVCPSSHFDLRLTPVAGFLSNPAEPISELSPTWDFTTASDFLIGVTVRDVPAGVLYNTSIEVHSINIGNAWFNDTLNLAAISAETGVFYPPRELVYNGHANWGSVLSSVCGPSLNCDVFGFPTAELLYLLSSRPDLLSSPPDTLTITFEVTYFIYEVGYYNPSSRHLLSTHDSEHEFVGLSRERVTLVVQFQERREFPRERPPTLELSLWSIAIILFTLLAACVVCLCCIRWIVVQYRAKDTDYERVPDEYHSS